MSIDVPFATSGTTGDPVTWFRTQDQLAAETHLLAELVGTVEQVVSFAPPHHLYGRLFGVELPRLLGVDVVPAWDDPLTLPTLATDVLIVCVPSTWSLLRRHLPTLAERRVVATHSTARTTLSCYDVAAALPGLAGIELLGSTETGAVATRRIDPVERHQTEWTLLPDVDQVADPDRLHVRGPRIGRRHDMARPPGSWLMPDLITPTGPRTFRHLGRAGRLVKVNGKRCDLSAIESLVRVTAQVEVECVPVVDQIRGEHYDLYYTSETLTPADIRTRLAEVRGDNPAPRLVHRMELLPSR
ncbi:MAG TPA: hypothetical protein VM677_26625 [Actinokineospora sp.]|jgi:acyl-coenzyme A synthetase/AMP-(fatty) acid ligase|nr:hypothetical protein [Actinokineospora sp.]